MRSTRPATSFAHKGYVNRQTTLGTREPANDLGHSELGST